MFYMLNAVCSFTLWGTTVTAMVLEVFFKLIFSKKSWTNTASSEIIQRNYKLWFVISLLEQTVSALLAVQDHSAQVDCILFTFSKDAYK